jgi:hypothetical protein
MNADLLRLAWLVLLIAAVWGSASPLPAQTGHAERYLSEETFSSER